MNQFTSSPIQIFAQPIEGIIEQTIAFRQLGRVQCLGTSWPGKLYQPQRLITLMPKQTIRIVGRQGITLLIEPLQEN